MALLVAQRSTCPSRRVGAIIINPETYSVIATGYNGAPRGMPHCDERCLERIPGEDWDKCRAVHGEMNAILNAAYNGHSTRNACIYLTCTPCTQCASAIINAGIIGICAPHVYRQSEPVHFLERAGVTVRIIDGYKDKAYSLIHHTRRV